MNKFFKNQELQFRSLFFLFITLYFVLFFACSFFTPLLADDYNYLMLSRGENYFLIELLFNLKKHYFEWGGRMISHFIAGILLWTRGTFDTPLFYATFNTLILSYILYGSKKIIYYSNQSKFNFNSSTSSFYHENSRKTSNLNIDNKIEMDIANREFKYQFHYFIFSAILFFFTTNCKYHYQTMFWVTGSANYMWMFAILIFYLSYNNEIFFNSNSQHIPTISFKSLFLTFIIAFVTGATNENVGIAVISFLTLKLIVNSNFLKKYFNSTISTSTLIINLFGLASGSAWLLLAPGNKVRDTIANPNGTGTLIQKINSWLDSLVVFLGRPEGLIILLVFFGSLLFLKKHKINQNKTLTKKLPIQNSFISKVNSLIKTLINIKLSTIISFLITNPLFTLWLLMTGSYLGHTGNFYGRKSFNIGWIFSLFLIDYLVKKNLLEFLLSTLKSKLIYLSMILVFLSCLRWGYDFNVIFEYNNLVEQREDEIIEQKIKGTKNIITYNLASPYDLEDLSINSNHWINTPYAKYLDIDSISVTPHK